MNFIGWIRDLFGIQKDMYETKKTRLEIEKIEEEKREQRLRIALATMEDVEKYDPKLKALVDKITGHGRGGDIGGIGGGKFLRLALYMWIAEYRQHKGRFILRLVLTLIISLGLSFLVIYLLWKAARFLLHGMW